MNIECPKCSTIHRLNVDCDLLCKKCEEDLAKHSYKIHKKSALSVTGALVLGAFSYHQIDEHFFTENRYPLSIEYSIADGCIRSDQTPVTMQVLQAKRNMCLCGLNKTIQDIPYKEYKQDPKKFYNSFAANTLDCK